jgi:chromosome segregation ATPase
MDNFRTVAAVLVVLLAFTGFQLIANYSLRRAVREDVKTQVADTQNTKAEMMMHHKQLQAARRLMDDLSKSINAASASMTALDATLGKLEKAAAGLDSKLKAATDGLGTKVGAIETRLKELEAAADALKKKIGLLGGAADDAGAARATLTTLQKQLSGAAGRAKSADLGAQRALTLVGSLKTDFSKQKRELDELRLDDMKRNLGSIQDEIRKLSRSVQTLQLQD